MTTTDEITLIYALPAVVQERDQHAGARPTSCSTCSALVYLHETSFAAMDTLLDQGEVFRVLCPTCGITRLLEGTVSGNRRAQFSELSPPWMDEALETVRKDPEFQLLQRIMGDSMPEHDLIVLHMLSVMAIKEALLYEQGWAPRPDQEPQ